MVSPLEYMHQIDTHYFGASLLDLGLACICSAAHGFTRGNQHEGNELKSCNSSQKRACIGRWLSADGLSYIMSLFSPQNSSTPSICGKEWELINLLRKLLCENKPPFFATNTPQLEKSSSIEEHDCEQTFWMVLLFSTKYRTILPNPQRVRKHQKLEGLVW